jgi:hypothetical protein
MRLEQPSTVFHPSAKAHLNVRHETERIYVVSLDTRRSLQGSIQNISKREHHNFEFRHLMRNL